MQDDVVALFAYDRWANTKVLDACRKLTVEQYGAEHVPGWLERVYRRFEELRPTLTPERLNTVLTLRAVGRTFTLPRWAILRHIVNHSSYHRGQTASKLKRFGIEQPITDFFWWVIEQIPQET